MADEASRILRPPEYLNNAYAGGIGSLPGTLAYVARSIEQGRTERIARAQKMKSYLQAQGYSDAEMIANPQMRKVYMESIGMKTTQAVGERRGPFGILPRRREEVPAEQVPTARTASAILESPYDKQLGSMSLPQAQETFGQAGMSRLLETPETDIKQAALKQKQALVDQAADKLAGQGTDQLLKYQENVRKRLNDLYGKYGKDVMAKWIAGEVFGITDEQRKDADTVARLGQMSEVVESALFKSRFGLKIPKETGAKSAAEALSDFGIE